LDAVSEVWSEGEVIEFIIVEEVVEVDTVVGVADGKIMGEVLEFM
jgi:hypothetical protein